MFEPQVRADGTARVGSDRMSPACWVSISPSGASCSSVRPRQRRDTRSSGCGNTRLASGHAVGRGRHQAAAGLGEVGSSTRVSDESPMGWAYAAAAAATVLILSQGGRRQRGHAAPVRQRARDSGQPRDRALIEAAVVALLQLLLWRRFLLVTFDAEAARGRCQDQMVVFRHQSLDRRYCGGRGSRDRRLDVRALNAARDGRAS